MRVPIMPLSDALFNDLCRIHVEHRTNQYKTQGVYKLHRTDSIIYDIYSNSYQSSPRVKNNLKY